MGANYSSFESQNMYRNGFTKPNASLTPKPNASSTPKPSGITEFHSSVKWKAHFNNSKFSGKLLVIDFTATWCKPCRLMDPTIVEFAAKYTDIEFIKIDVDELMDVAQQFGVQVMPTFLLLKNGKEVDRIVGAKRDELQKKIEKHGA